MAHAKHPSLNSTKQLRHTTGLNERKGRREGVRNRPLLDDADFIATIAAAGFTREDAKTAIECRLLHEGRVHSYECGVGIATPPTAASLLSKPDVPVVRYRYRLS